MTSRSMTLHGAAPAASSDWRSLIRTGGVFLAVVPGVFALWAVLARLDGAAVAQGVVSVESSRKTIQHFEGGIVRDILIRDGDLVQQGAVLIRLDPTRIDSASDLYRNQLAAALIQEARLIAEREMSSEMLLPQEVAGLLAIPAIARAVDDQKRQFSERRGGR